MVKPDFKLTIGIDSQGFSPFIPEFDYLRVAARLDNNVIFQLPVIAINLEIDILVNFRIFYRLVGRNTFTPFGRIITDIVIVFGRQDAFGGNKRLCLGVNK